jgi:hypothetical protein
MKQVAWNKWSLLLKIQKQNTQPLQLFTEIIKTEVFTEVFLSAKLKDLGAYPVVLIKSGGKCKRF